MHYPNLTSPKELMMLLRKYNFICKKRLGQNFLIDHNILRIIGRVLEPQKDDHILEIGTGIGTLSAYLSPLVKEVITIEKDKQLIPLIKNNLSPFDNIEMIFLDIMDVNFYSFIEEYKKDGREIHKIVGNLPYYISIPLIRKVVELNKEIKIAVFLVQKEVGMRLLALPGEKDYGILSIAVRYYSRPQKIHHVPATVFYPKPKVNSMIIKLEVLETPSIKVVNEKLFFEIVRASFQQRRKSIINSLANYFCEKFDKTDIEKILEKADINKDVRAEKLSPKEFGLIANIMEDKINH